MDPAAANPPYGSVQRRRWHIVLAMDADALRRLFVLSNAFKEGDLPVGGTHDDVVRQEARRELLATRVSDIRRARFVDDGVTAALERGRDRSRDVDVDPL